MMYFLKTYKGYKKAKENGLSIFFWRWLFEKWKHDLCMLVWFSYAWPMVLIAVLIAVVGFIGAALEKFSQYYFLKHKTMKLFSAEWVPNKHYDIARDFHSILRNRNKQNENNI